MGKNIQMAGEEEKEKKKVFSKALWELKKPNSVSQLPVSFQILATQYWYVLATTLCMYLKWTVNSLQKGLTRD